MHINSLSPVLQVNTVSVKENGRLVLDGLNFTIRRGEQWAIVGSSGSGKTTLLHTLAGKHAYTGTITFGAELPASATKMVLVEQQHRFKNRSNTYTFYYQQRFNASDAEDAATVGEELESHIFSIGNSKAQRQAALEHVVNLFKLQELLSVNLIQLSNGENKRLQLAKALLLQPTILLLDNPFVGLDKASREILVEVLTEISSASSNIQIVLVTSAQSIPAFITNVLHLKTSGVFTTGDVHSFRAAHLDPEPEKRPRIENALLTQLSTRSAAHHFEYAVRMKNVHVKYNNRTILENIWWDVRNGDKWALSGPNGSGKSTLLSLINADNPQAYANEIYLFDRRRGSGESIWDIKRQIGFVSPELHLYFDTGINCFDVVASGLFDTIGLFRLLNEEQVQLVEDWLKVLQVEQTRNKLLVQLSNSQQRLVLLARALVKNPPVLILDEPCQGLDEEQVAAFKLIVDEICTRSHKTLIYVSHYPHEIPGCVDKFLRLENGRIV